MPILNIGKQRDILSRLAPNCKKVQFDISSLRKPQKLYDRYNIPREETLIAYCKSFIPFFGMAIGGIVFTDNAFYINVTNSTLPSNRILYTDLGKYIITQHAQIVRNDEKGGVYLQDAESEHEIYAERLLRKNTFGSEILEILTAIQSVCCEEYPGVLKQFETLADRIFTAAKSEEQTGILSDRLRSTLLSLMKNTKYSDRSAELIAKNYFRLRNLEWYQKFFESLPETVSKEMKEKIGNPPEDFFKELISDLSNLSLEFSSEYLLNTDHNLHIDSDISKNDFIVAIYITARRNRFESARTLTQQFTSRFGSHASHDIENFICIYGSMQMKKVFDKIKNNESIPDDWLYITDGMGLTPLHYFLILGIDPSPLFVPDRDWSEPLEYIPMGDIRIAYMYTTLSYMKCDRTQRIDVFFHAHSVLKLIAGEINKLENLLSEMRNALDELCDILLKTQLRYAYASLRNREKLPELAALIDEVNKTYSEVNEAIILIIDGINLAKNEATRFYKAIIKETKLFINETKNIGNPLINLLFLIYENADPSINLSKILENSVTADTLKLYQFSGFFILLPTNIELNAPYREVYIKNGVITDSLTGHEDDFFDYNINRAFGTSWFSEEAHSDMNLLKREFRALSKKYHPDVSRLKRATAIFQDISSEYDELTQND